MNLAVRGIDADIKWNNEGSLPSGRVPAAQVRLRDGEPTVQHLGLVARQLDGDARWTFGTPPQGNANFAWLQHIIHHLAPRGTAGVVLANGSMSSQQSGEGDIREGHDRGRCS